MAFGIVKDFLITGEITDLKGAWKHPWITKLLSSLFDLIS